MISSLASKSPSIARGLDQLENIYRWTYYIEEICQMVEREMTDNNLKMVELILQYIEVFNRYEKALVIGSEYGVRE